jgi:hypothetical protein
VEHYSEIVWRIERKRKRLALLDREMKIQTERDNPAEMSGF